MDKIGLGHTPSPALEDWERFVQRIIHPKNKVTIAVAGKYGLQDAYKSIYEALIHAGALHNTKVKIQRIDVEDIEQRGAREVIGEVDGILVPGGFGERGIEGKIAATRWARTRNVPFFGICLGMQVASIEFARSVLDLKDAHSTEFAPHTPHPVIDLMEAQQKVTDKGATMRLGSYPCALRAGSLAHKLYGRTEIGERHRHRFEFNNAYRPAFESRGMVFSGLSPDGNLVEIMELRDHPFFVGTQFHPEFRSRPTLPHPLFAGFVAAALRFQEQKSGVATTANR